MEVLQTRILRHLGTLARCIHSIMDEKFRSYGFQRGQFIFFTRICEEPGMTLTQLTASCKVDKGTTTKAVDKLAAAGYVEKRRNSRDGRTWNVYPTAQGMGLYDAFIAEENRQAAVCLQGLTDEEQAQAEALAAYMSERAAREWQHVKTQRRDADADIS